MTSWSQNCRSRQLPTSGTAPANPGGFSTYALVVDDLDNGGKLASVRAVVDEENAADLDLRPLGSDDADITHFWRLVGVDVSESVVRRSRVSSS